VEIKNLSFIYTIMAFNFDRLMKSERTGRETAPKYLYVDIEIPNTSGKQQPISYNESRTSSYIDVASDYYISIVKFSLPTFNLPLFIPMIRNPSSSINETSYSFTMTYKTYTKQTYLNYVSPNLDAPAPSSSSSQNLTSDYYFVYSYNYVVNMLNDTLKACYDDLDTLVTAGSDTLPSTYCPFFVFDPSSKSLVAYFDKDGYDTGLSNPISVYCNEEMYNLLCGFEFIRNRSNGDGKTYRFNVEQQSLGNLSYFDDYTAIVMSEEFTSVSNWSPLRSVVFTSQRLPIVGTLVSRNQSFGSANSSFQSSVSSASQNIITDMDISEFDAQLRYAPFFYRLIDLVGDGSIESLDINVYWKDIYGNMYPFQLPNLSSCFIKLLFLRKY
jgi:hypothetical protein